MDKHGVHISVTDKETAWELVRVSARDESKVLAAIDEIQNEVLRYIFEPKTRSLVCVVARFLAQPSRPHAFMCLTHVPARYTGTVSGGTQISLMETIKV